MSKEKTNLEEAYIIVWEENGHQRFHIPTMEEVTEFSKRNKSPSEGITICVSHGLNIEPKHYVFDYDVVEKIIKHRYAGVPSNIIVAKIKKRIKVVLEDTL